VGDGDEGLQTWILSERGRTGGTARPSRVLRTGAWSTLGGQQAHRWSTDSGASRWHTPPHAAHFAEDSAWRRCHSGRLWIQASRIVRSSCAWQHQTGSVRAPIGRTISSVVRPHTTHGWPPTPVEPRFRSAVDRHDAARSASCTSRRLSRASSMQRSASQRRSASSCPVNSKLNGPQAGRREDQTVSDFVTPARSIDGQPRWNAALSVTTWSWAL
jgi:hypothetical protein